MEKNFWNIHRVQATILQDDEEKVVVEESFKADTFTAFMSVLHMYETFGWWRRADYLKVHFAESWNEMHHLLIMEELGGNSWWFDRILAQNIATFYYFMTVFLYIISPRMAYHFSECVESHAFETYDKFLKASGEELKNMPAPDIAVKYYTGSDLYLFDEFQTSRAPNTRRPVIENLYDVFVNIRDDEAEHCKTMRACQTLGSLRSPHSILEDDTEEESGCVVPEAAHCKDSPHTLPFFCLFISFIIPRRQRNKQSHRAMALRIRKATTLLFSGGITQGTDRISRTGALLSRWISSASSSSAVVADDDESGGIYGLGSVLKEYEDYRRSLYGEITHKALLVDAVGTLLVPAQPTAQIYKNIGEKYGVEFSEAEILTRYRRAYQKPWGGSHLRYVNDARPFWQYIVTASTGCSDSQYFEELYSYFTTEQAWKLCDPDAEKVFKAIKEAGVKVAIVSNFDTRLRPLLRALRCEDWFDAVAVSAEVEAEKPNPTIFLKACELLEVNPEDAVHVGDDRRNDVWGARDAGCDAWLWGSEVTSFKQVAQRIGVKV